MSLKDAARFNDAKPGLPFLSWAGTTGPAMFKSLDDAARSP
jgi:hypothetical protein